MKILYNSNGDTCKCDDDQVEKMIKIGYKREKPKKITNDKKSLPKEKVKKPTKIIDELPSPPSSPKKNKKIKDIIL